MVAEKFEICMSQIAKMNLKFTMFGEIFAIYISQIAKMILKFIHHGWRKFRNLHVSNSYNEG